MIIKVDFSSEVISIGEPIPFQNIVDVPCLCKLKAGKFTIEFVSTHTKIEGNLKGWSIEDFSAKALVGVGGEYVYYAHGLISIQHIEETNYKVLSLSLFYNSHGWLPVIENGNYTIPKQFWNDEPDWLP